jgi:hypothetical protein
MAAKPQSTLRSWLKMQPVPFRVRAEYEDGSERVFKLNDSRSRIRDAETMLQTAVSAEALDAEGEVIRIWSAEPNASRAVSSTWGDPMLMVTKVSALMVEAADRAAERHADAYQKAFDAQTALMSQVIALMQAQSTRLSELEEAYHERVMNEGEPPAPEVTSESTQLVKNILEVAAPMVLHSMMKPDPPPSNGAPTS